MSKNYVQIDLKDNIIVAITPLEKGLVTQVAGKQVVLKENIKQKHKYSLNDFNIGDEIYMYGVLIGKAMHPILEGCAITIENVKHASAEFQDSKDKFTWTAPDASNFVGRTFEGYHRQDGKVGTANYWLVIPLTFCENRNVKHDGGCGGIRQDSEVLVKLLAGYIANPNVAGATIFSLGCQNAQISMLQDAIDAIAPNNKKPVHYLEQQQSASERHLIEEAVKHTFLGLVDANKIERKPAPLSKLVLGLECGGSDGFSGISANPALGYTSDLLVALGGSAVLSEFPELNGVEQELINRCETAEDSKKFYDLMRAYSASAVAVGSGFENNPSPGNIKDGLITDAMKSAGAAKKGGTSPVIKVLDYTEQVTKPGLNLLCTPGNDVESTTGLVGSGCNVVVFTTGLGTPTGNPVAPVLKMSSNTNLFERMNDIIDINAGTVITGEDTIESMGEKILDHIIRVASGETPSKAVLHGNNDFIPWKRGVSL